MSPDTTLNQLELGLPPELIERICSCVGHPSDLLRLALACKAWKAAIIPRHIQLRHIRCDFRRKSLWRILISRPVLASFVRRLEIRPERQNESSIEATSLPTFLTDGSTDQVDDPVELSEEDIVTAMESLQAAVRYMCNLQRFYWDERDFPIPRQIWTPLLSEFGGANLEEFQVALVPWGSVESLNCALESIRKLSNLKAVSFAARSILVGLEIFWPIVNMLIRDCPGLEKLHLAPAVGPAGCQYLMGIYARATWPNLTHLTVESTPMLDAYRYADHEYWQPIFTTFLKRHKKLQHIALPFGLLNIAEGIRFASIESTDTDNIAKVDGVEENFSYGTADNLRHLSRLSFHDDDELSLEIIQTAGRTLRTLRVACDSLNIVKTLVEHAPGLEELYFDRCPIKHRGCMTYEKKAAEPFYEALKGLQRLARLGGIPIQGAPRLRQFEQVISRLAEIKSLKYVEIIDHANSDSMYSPTKWVILQRNQDGNCVGCIDAPDQRAIRKSSHGETFWGFL
ncbi:hypothetical protein M422DRAFT_71273 [Sphaerobolus stellatus SS14]|uniref:Unplaced genomic scaffold SPHSTscaffold_212, whole genome shotgun sequence n=1 Tax=Sphaerobolus stellatus (strain SS14) TaxID=990650 RepID=A0A0C9TI84_SPHS4|nr:hypothetical protein M422DRAFT_71273 [Sphaerobolus stellatus SS14]